MVILRLAIDQINLWNTDLKIKVDGNFKCRCFNARDSWTSCNILWRPRKILGRIRHCNRRSPAQILRSAMVKTCFSQIPPVSARLRDEEKIVGCSKNSFLVSRRLMGDKMDDDYDSPIEEPWLLESSLDDSYGFTAEDKIVRLLNSDFFKSRSLNHLTLEDGNDSQEVIDMNKSIDHDKTLYESDQPVEEPWLFESSLSNPSFEAKINKVLVEDDSKAGEYSDEQHQKVIDKYADEESRATKDLSAAINDHVASESEEEVDVSSQEDVVTTVILINSSLCTMQRIAVLEDGKLVELLLEPVKNNIQCDSVYLGTVTKLLPHMTGAFVDIGKNSLMSMKSFSKKPFIFPPFRQRKKKDTHAQLYGSVVQKDVENPNNGELSDETDEHNSEEDLVQLLHEYFDEHEIEDDIDITEDAKENVNGNASGYYKLEGKEFHRDTENNPFSKLDPVYLNSHFLNPSVLEVAKDCKETWAQVQRGTKVIVQVVKEGLGSKGPKLTAYPKLRSRFWILSTSSNKIGISRKISGPERVRLKGIAKKLLPEGYGLIVRTVAAGHTLEELQKDLDGLLSTWKSIVENAKSAALAAEDGVEGAVPVILHRAMGQTLHVVQDYFNENVKSMVVDSLRTYHEVTRYLEDIAPDLCDRVELYQNRTPLFDEYNVEEELDNILSKRVSLSNGGYLVIEQTEALVSIDVNGGQCMLGQGNSQDEAILEVNLAAAKQIARELRLRDIGGIIVVDFIDMLDESDRRLVYNEVKKAVARDRSAVSISELSKNGLMEITRQRVRPSVTYMVTEPCTCCHATGRVEAMETSFSRIEHEICRSLAKMKQKIDWGNPKSWPRFVLQVDKLMATYITSGKETRLALLSSSLRVWILLKIAKNFTRGEFELKLITDEKEYKTHQAAIAMFTKATDAETPTNTFEGKFSHFPTKKRKSNGNN